MRLDSSLVSPGYGGSGIVSRSEGMSEFEIPKSSHRYPGGGNAVETLTFPAGSPEQTTKEPKIFYGTALKLAKKYDDSLYKEFAVGPRGLKHLEGRVSRPTLRSERATERTT